MHRELTESNKVHKEPSSSGRDLELVHSEALDQSVEEVTEAHHLDPFHLT